MSTHSYSQDCYFCGASDSAMICEDNKPPSLDFTCVSCGKYNVVTWEVLSLEEVNEEREELGLEPLKKLNDKKY